MNESDIGLFIGKFEAKIDALEKSVLRLETCVSALTTAMAEHKSGWQVIFMLSSISAILGATVHRPIEAIIGLFK